MSAQATALERDDYVVAQNWSGYRPEHHAIWRELFDRQSKLLPGLHLRRATQSSPSTSVLQRGSSPRQGLRCVP